MAFKQIFLFVIFAFVGDALKWNNCGKLFVESVELALLCLDYSENYKLNANTSALFNFPASFILQHPTFKKHLKLFITNICCFQRIQRVKHQHPLTTALMHYSA